MKKFQAEVMVVWHDILGSTQSSTLHIEVDAEDINTAETLAYAEAKEWLKTTEDPGGCEVIRLTEIFMNLRLVWWDAEDDAINETTIEIPKTENPVEAGLVWFKEYIEENPDLKKAGAGVCDLSCIYEILPSGEKKLLYENSFS